MIDEKIKEEILAGYNLGKCSFYNGFSNSQDELAPTLCNHPYLFDYLYTLKEFSAGLGRIDIREIKIKRYLNENTMEDNLDGNASIIFLVADKEENSGSSRWKLVHIDVKKTGECKYQSSFHKDIGRALDDLPPSLEDLKTALENVAEKHRQTSPDFQATFQDQLRIRQEHGFSWATAELVQRQAALLPYVEVISKDPSNRFSIDSISKLDGAWCLQITDSQLKYMPQNIKQMRENRGANDAFNNAPLTRHPPTISETGELRFALTRAPSQRIKDSRYDGQRALLRKLKKVYAQTRKAASPQL